MGPNSLTRSDHCSISSIESSCSLSYFNENFDDSTSSLSSSETTMLTISSNSRSSGPCKKTERAKCEDEWSDNLKEAEHQSRGRAAGKRRDLSSPPPERRSDIPARTRERASSMDQLSYSNKLRRLPRAGTSQRSSL